MAEQLKTDKNTWVKGISLEDNIRGVAIEATDLVRQMARRHQLSEKGAIGLGEAVLGALMMASFCKKGQKINLNIQGKGLFQQGLVDAHPEGHVRGYVIERETAQEEKDQGPWGSGLLSVLRTQDQPGAKPYIGTVPLLTGHLAKDLTYYWVQSEQIPSAVGLAVSFSHGEIQSAGGFLVQALPGAQESSVRLIEKHIAEIASLQQLVREQKDPLYLLTHIFQSQAFSVLEEKPLVFHCECSWERVERALRLLGQSELEGMLKECQAPEAHPHSVVHCDFCAKDYPLSAPVIQKILSQIQGT
ncbi:MAG: Hsp33 family molecular chaperone HslO [Bdellovibrionia bacterium]